MAGPLDSLLGMLGLGGGAPGPQAADPYALAAQLGATTDPTQRAALTTQMNTALANQQRAARGMALLQGGLGIMGAQNAQGRPAPFGQALNQGMQQGMQGYDQYLDRARRLQMGLQQTQHMGQQGAAGAQQLQLGAQQLESNKAIAEWSKQITGMQQGISDPKAIQFLLQARTGREMAIALQGQAAQADAEGKHDVANLLRNAAQVAPADPSKALDILKSTVPRPLAPEQIEHYHHLNKVEDATAEFYRNYRGPAAAAKLTDADLKAAQKSVEDAEKILNSSGSDYHTAPNAANVVAQQRAALAGHGPWPEDLVPPPHWWKGTGWSPGIHQLPDGKYYYWDGQIAMPLATEDELNPSESAAVPPP